MKLLFVVPLAAAGLLAMAGAANGEVVGVGMQPTGRAMLEQNADESAQDITDMPYGDLGQPRKAPSHSIANASYGGEADVHGETGAPRQPRCPSGSQCTNFRGR